MDQTTTGYGNADNQNDVNNFVRLQDEVKLMVVGMPNVGKSSLINSLRRKYLKKGTHHITHYMVYYFT